MQYLLTGEIQEMDDNIFVRENIETLNDAILIFELYKRFSNAERDKVIQDSTEIEVGTYITACIRMSSIDSSLFDAETLRDISVRYLRIFKGK